MEQDQGGLVGPTPDKELTPIQTEVQSERAPTSPPLPHPKLARKSLLLIVCSVLAFIVVWGGIVLLQSSQVSEGDRQPFEEQPFKDKPARTPVSPTSGATEKQASADLSVLLITVDMPNHLLVTDPQGRRVGYDPNTNS